MTPEIATIFGCPFCGFRVSGAERACPRCGREFSEGTEFECPFCSSPVKPTDGSCPACEVQFHKIAAQASEQLLDKAVTKIAEELDKLTELDGKSARCPRCSELLEAPGAPCKKCMERHIEEAHEEGQSATDFVDGELFGDLEEEAYECPVCGAEVRLSDPKCRQCGAEFEEEEEEPQEVLEEVPSERESAQIIPEDDAATCPSCDNVVSITDPVCPHCGAEFEEEQEELPPEPELEADAAEEDLASCPVCGTLASLTADVCPHCGIEFEGDEEAVAAPSPEKLVVKPKIVTKRKKGIIKPSRVPPRKEPRGLSNGTGIVNGRGRTNGRGRVNGTHLVNGIGAVNGRGRINGQGRVNGAVNGKDLVNGTGALNGGRLGAQRPIGPRGRYQILFKWRFLALLIALVVILAAFAYMAGVVEKPPYEVDGDGGDWSDETMFGIASSSSLPSTNIVEWSVAPYRNELYIYVRTEEATMADDEVESFFLFIDSDDSTSTGYAILGIGADFMVELQGWNGSVRQSTVWRYDSLDDQLDWSSWAYAATAISALDENQLEAMTGLPFEVGESSRFVLVSRGEQSTGSASYPVVLKGGLLIIEVSPSLDVAADGLLAMDQSAQLMTLTFRCEGDGGTINTVTPELLGVSSSDSIQQLSIEPGEEHMDGFHVDSSGLAPGQFVSASIEADDISSSFSRIHIVGNSVRAYVGSAPDAISIDGAFADWAGKTATDFDSAPLSNPDIDIDEVGAHNSTVDSFFYISVCGEICSGDFVPKTGSKPSGTGGGTVVPARRTAEDFIRVYIDSDQSTSTGKVITSGDTPIGADYMIEITGFCCEIKSTAIMMYHSNDWVGLGAPVDAVIDISRMEIGVTSSSIGASTGPIDFLIISTDWKGNEDIASTGATTLRVKHWVVADDGSSSGATAMSYQRKMFYDGTNFWSFYYDGTDTVYSNSSDGGTTWSDGEQAFSTAGVMDTSLWYDSGDQLVYVVGDTSTASEYVYIQRGEVSPSTQTIAWDGEETLSVSTIDLGGKNTYICRDTDDFLWILSSQQTQGSPERYNLVAYQSDSTDDITAWTQSGTMLSSATENVDLKGSILPAGSDSDVLAVYNYDTNVIARKCTSGSWGDIEEIYTDGGETGYMTTAPASAVVDGNGVLHVVYGDETKDGGVAKPHIQYRCRHPTGDWMDAIIIDEDGDNVRHWYPTISLDTSTGNVYAFWLQTNNYNIVCKKNVSGDWSFVTLGGQTSYTKQYLTSVYSVSGEANICWQWTQNTTTVEVIFDKIPEFGDLVVPIIIIMAVFFVMSRKRRRNGSALPEDELSY